MNGETPIKIDSSFMSSLLSFLAHSSCSDLTVFVIVFIVKVSSETLCIAAVKQQIAGLGINVTFYLLVPQSPARTPCSDNLVVLPYSQINILHPD